MTLPRSALAVFKRPAAALTVIASVMPPTWRTTGTVSRWPTFRRMPASDAGRRLEFLSDEEPKLIQQFGRQDRLLCEDRALFDEITARGRRGQRHAANTLVVHRLVLIRERQ